MGVFAASRVALQADFAVRAAAGGASEPRSRADRVALRYDVHANALRRV
jgi:hypothetical protein